MSPIDLPLFRRDDCPAATQLTVPTTRQWLFFGDRLLCQQGKPCWLPVSDQLLREQQLLVLGEVDGVTLVAQEVGDESAHAGEWLSLRELLAELDHASLQAVMTARAGHRWAARSRYCGACGSANLALAADWSRQCSNPSCQQRQFPRLDPAVIVLVSYGEHCLLGRSPTWPGHRYSTLAGFVEPGETLEQAVAREVHEEAGVSLAEIEYVASQPWPFPSSLMLGFQARAASEHIRCGEELADVGWFSRRDIAQRQASGELSLPPAGAISRRLIDDWIFQVAPV